LTRSELEHIIRAAGAIANDDQIVVIGSQSVLGQFPTAPTSLLASMEADIYPRNKPELADLVDGSIGEGSFFHERFGYYAQGVSSATATLPQRWEKRLVSVRNANTGNVEGLCLEVYDLAIAKYVAGREKDLAFTRELARHKMTTLDVLLDRLRETEVRPAVAKLVGGRIRRDFPIMGARSR
jgi:hypothetical protein